MYQSRCEDVSCLQTVTDLIPSNKTASSLHTVTVIFVVSLSLTAAFHRVTVVFGFRMISKHYKNSFNI